MRYLLRGSLLMLLFLVWGCFSEAQATHIRAGDITAKRDTTPNPNPRRFFFTMTIYTDKASSAEDPIVFMNMGGGVILEVPRGQVVDIGNETDREVYKWEYTFPTDGTHRVSWVGVNRNNDILNMAPPSDQRSFFIETVVSINALRGFNSTPMLTVAPIDVAAVGRKFVHNPGAYDADGDSLSFKLIVPRYEDAQGRITVVPGYSLPHLTFRNANCTTSDGSGPATLSLDPLTGQLTWDSPCVKGEYNVAFVVEEWRVSPRGGAVKLGEVVRDMQILVKETPNRPPVLVPRDTCIVAGTLLRGTVIATDPDNDLIDITVAGSGIVPPATFTQNTRTPGRSTGTLQWQTQCNDVRESAYQVIFRATDVRPPGQTRLTDVQPWNITVVGPPPQNLKVKEAGQSTVEVSWDSYTCANAQTMRVYRREGPSGFVPGPCETGVPASTGYTLIGEVDANKTNFLDNNVQAGVEYCYIIYAVFPSPGRGESLASNEACIGVERDIPYLTNVTVDETSATSGRITVKWTQPEVSSPTEILEYRLSRKEGQATGTGFTEIFRSRRLTDTTFTDTKLNTLEKAYRYRLELYQVPTTGGQPTELRTGAEASSVRLEVAPLAGNEAAFELKWTYQVPWDNSLLQDRVYRRAEGGALVLLTSVPGTAGTYIDRSAELKRGSDYCYVVETAGEYTVVGLPKPLLNRSQEACAQLPLEICAPELSIDALDCAAFAQNPLQPPYQNVLNWVPNISGNCTDQIDFYTVYFRDTQDGEYIKLGTTKETTYTHTGLESFAGCYVVTATDTDGRESVFSNEVCKDNCLSFILPNIITPNGDGKNDVFRPGPGTAFIKSMKFQVFNRWGVKVYDQNATSGGDALYINWPGIDNSGNRLTDGTYYYEAEVEFYTLDPSKAKATYKGWVEIIR